MGKKDPRVDAYIDKAAPFGRPVMKHLRKIVHAGCPDVVETIKWGVPHFEYHGLLCGMAAFKAHCAFFCHRALSDSLKAAGISGEMIDHLKRFTSIDELPKAALLKNMVQQAARLKASGVQPPVRPKKEKKPLVVPADLKKALAKNQRAKATFDNFSYTRRKDYITWITEAKREETRKNRLATTVKWLAEGKARHWKYEKC